MSDTTWEISSFKFWRWTKSDELGQGDEWPTALILKNSSPLVVEAIERAAKMADIKLKRVS